MLENNEMFITSLFIRASKMSREYAFFLGSLENWTKTTKLNSYINVKWIAKCDFRSLSVGGSYIKSLLEGEGNNAEKLEELDIPYERQHPINS